MTTDQEVAWGGDFGNAYHQRSPGSERANYMFFRRALQNPVDSAACPLEPQTVLEYGAGTGANIRALLRLLPEAGITAVELNRHACEILQATCPKVRVINGSALDPSALTQTFDLVLTKGFLIHLAPEHLNLMYERIYASASRWILIAEYYNPTLVMIPYRGERDLLWKGDYAGDMLQRYPDLALRSYGFTYHGDRYPQDDLTWFLLEKIGGAEVAARMVA